MFRSRHTTLDSSIRDNLVNIELQIKRGKNFRYIRHVLLVIISGQIPPENTNKAKYTWCAVGCIVIIFFGGSMINYVIIDMVYIKYLIQV